jgi:hypothetical protein
MVWFTQTVVPSHGLHQPVEYGVMSTSNSGKVGFAVVQDVRQGLIIVSTRAPSLVAILELAGSIELHSPVMHGE